MIRFLTYLSNPGIKLYVLVFLTSCISVYFEVPQPKGIKSLDQFPVTIRGQYLIEDDTIIIKTDLYQYPDESEKKITVNEIENSPEIYIKEDIIFDEKFMPGIGVKYNIISDTITYSYKLKLTEVLSDSVKLKSYKGKFFLSRKVSNNEYWELILLIRQDNGNLLISLVDVDKEEISELSIITDFNKIGESEYLISPSKKKLMKLIEKGLIDEGDTLVKIR